MSYQQHHHDDNDSPPSSRSSTTTYFGTSTTNNTNTTTTTFAATAPSGSRHAARLQRLALSTQPEWTEPPSPPSLPRRLISRSFSSTSSSSTTTDPAALSKPKSYLSKLLWKRPDPEINPEDDEDGHHQHHTPSSREPGRRAGGGGGGEGAGTEVYRYQRDGTVTYKKVGRGGSSELRISAPEGSGEAEAMERVARRLGGGGLGRLGDAGGGGGRGERRTVGKIEEL